MKRNITITVNAAITGIMTTTAVTTTIIMKREKPKSTGYRHSCIIAVKDSILQNSTALWRLSGQET